MVAEIATSPCPAGAGLWLLAMTNIDALRVYQHVPEAMGAPESKKAKKFANFGNILA